ncbi:MAG: tape measure protein [Oscillospiraceae bacterium]
MYDGELVFNTQMDASGFQKGANKINQIVSGLGIFKLISKGVEMVTGSIDSALGRIDTMEQFGRVMGTMTGDIELTNNALEETREIVTGTAFGLDVAAKSVQNFVARGMEVEKSTNTVKRWGDAVAFYTDGTNASFSSVTNALSKMQTKGTVTMEHMQTILEAGIPAIEIYAAKMGVSTEEVTKQMGKGEISADSFITAMNSAFEEGAGKFPELTNAAKEAGASFTGTMDNMRAAVTRGVQAIVTSIDEGLTAVNLPTIREMISSTGKIFESGLKTVATLVPNAIGHIKNFADTILNSGAAHNLKQTAESAKEMGAQVLDAAKNILPRLESAFVSVSKATTGIFAKGLSFVNTSILPKAISLLDKFTKHIDVALPLVLGFATAIKTWKAAQAIGTTIEGVVKVVKAFTSAESALEVKLLASVLVMKAKTAATTTDTAATAGATVAQKALNAAMAANPIGLVITVIAALAVGIGTYMAVSSKAAKQTEALNANMKGIGEAASEYMSGIASAESQLASFANSTSMTTEEQQALASEISAVQNSITQTIRTAIAERGYLLDSDIAKLNEYYAQLRELHTQQLQIERERAAAVADIALADSERRNVSLEEYQASAQKWIKTAQDQATEEKRIIEEQAIAEIAALKQKLEAEGATRDEIAAAVQERLAQRDADLAGVNDNLAQITAAYANGYAELLAKDEDYAAKNAEKNQKLEDEDARHQAELEKIQSAYYDSEAKRQYYLNQENSKHTENTKQIWNDYSASLTKTQQDQLAALLAMSSQTELYGGALTTKTKTIVGDIISSLDTLPPETRQIMQDAMAPMLEEMEKAEPGLYRKAESIANGILARLRKAFDENSPSKATRKIFRFLMQGGGLGLEDEEPTLYKQVEGIGQNVLSRFSGLTQSKATSLVAQLQAGVSANQTRLAYASAAPYSGGGAGGVLGGTNVSLVQNITTPKALSSAEITQEGLSFAQRAKWKLP